MKFLDILKTIFGGKLNDLLSNNKITVFDFSRNSTTVLEVKEGSKLSIDIGKATEKEKKQIKKEIIDVIVQKDEDAFLTDSSSRKTEQIFKNLPKRKDKELLAFYKDKLHPDMFRALEASLMVRNSFKKGEDISELKRDIARKYPEFGNNICNLATQGYFDEHFRELYHSMLEDEEFDIVSYQKKVEKIVRSLPYIVFITRYKTYKELSGEVYYKLGNLKKYGTGKLLLHGLGNENVETTLRILDEYKEDKGIIIQKDINPQKTIITATLIF